MKPAGEKASRDCADDGRDPKEPELRERPAADEDRGTRASCGIYREIRDRDADEMNEREREADRNSSESCDGFFGRGAEDDGQEDEREDDLQR